jgi:hypothetical protein
MTIASGANIQKTGQTYESPLSFMRGSITVEPPSLALGTTTFIGNLAGDGTHLAMATNGFTGALSGVGSYTQMGGGRSVASQGHAAEAFEQNISTMVASVPETAVSNALGTIGFTGALAGVGTTRAFGTTTFTGDLVAVGTQLEAGTDTFIGDLSAVGTELGFGVTDFIGELGAGGGRIRAFGTTTFIGDLAAVGSRLTSQMGRAIVTAEQPRQAHIWLRPPTIDIIAAGEASGTSTFIGDLAGVGTTLAFGTTTFIGEFASLGSRLTSGFGRMVIEAEQPIPSHTWLQHPLIPVSLFTASGSISFSGVLAAKGSGGADIAQGGGFSISSQGHAEQREQPQSVFSLPIFATPLQTRTATITFNGALFAKGVNLTAPEITGNPTNIYSQGHVLEVQSWLWGAIQVTPPKTVGTAFYEEAEQPRPAITFMHSGVPLSDLSIKTAKGTITATSVIFTAGFIQQTGALAARGFNKLDPNKEFGIGTITQTSNLFAKGIAFCPIPASATISFNGAIDAIGSFGTLHLGSGAVTFKGSLSAPALYWAWKPARVEATGTENPGGIKIKPRFIMDDLAASFVPDKHVGRRINNVTDGSSANIQSNKFTSAIHTALAGGTNNFWTIGDVYEILSNQGWLARGTITQTSALDAKLRPAKFCTAAKGSINFIGSLSSTDGFNDDTIARKTATITFSGALQSAPTKQKEAAIISSGALTAIGHSIVAGDLAMQGDRGSMFLEGPVGPGTINGLKQFIIDTAYGTAELYNNGFGAFYTLGGFEDQKREARGLINFTADLKAIPTADALKLMTATISFTGDLAAKADHVGITATTSFMGDLSAGTDLTQFAFGTSTLIGDLAGIGTDVSPIVSLSGGSATGNTPNTTGFRFQSDGGVDRNQSGSWTALSDWISPASAAPSDYEIRAVLTGGQAPSSGPTLNDWHALSSTRSWTLTLDEFQFGGFTILVSIRKGSGPVLDSGSYTGTNEGLN